MKKRIVYLLPLVAAFLTACAGTEDYLARTGYGAEEVAEVAAESLQGSAETDAAALAVHISGAVASPGVYYLPAGSRLIDAVALAGGLLADAGADGCNLAQELTDGAQYRIPTMEEAAALVASETSASLYDAEGRLDINRAGVAEFMTLSGIGETRAQAIVAYREEHGAFTDTAELKLVSGIGEATYANISSAVMVR